MPEISDRAEGIGSMNIAFVCSETDAGRIQKCLWHGFYDYCEGGFNGEQQVNDWQKSIMILHNALVAAKEGATEVPVEISVRDAYWILGLMKMVEEMSEGLTEDAVSNSRKELSNSGKI